MDKRLIAKITEAKKLIDELKQSGINATLDKKTGEITIQFSDFIASQDLQNGLY